MDTDEGAAAADGGAGAGSSREGAAHAGNSANGGAGANGARAREAPEEPATCRLDNPCRVVPAQVTEQDSLRGPASSSGAQVFWLVSIFFMRSWPHR